MTGVYLAKDGSISMGHYASACQTVWRNRKITQNNCVPLAEIVILPSHFVSSEPYFVVGNTHWIMWCVVLWDTSVLIDGHDFKPISACTRWRGNNDRRHTR